VTYKRVICVALHHISWSDVIGY